MRVGSINAVKLVEASDLVAILDYGRWMAEVISQQQSSFGIVDIDGDDQERVYVQSGGVVVIIKSHHGHLRERIDGGATSDLNSFRARTG
eukprot:scaffold154393_cov54-Attheya_sp.AAC.1